MKTRSKALLVVLGLIALLVFAFTVFVIHTVREANYYQGEVAKELNQILGFSHGSPYVITGDDAEEVFTLHTVSGGVMSAAGVKDGDIVIDYSITDFYRSLDERRGLKFTFDVVDGGDGGAIKNRETRSILLQIPAKR